MALSGVTEWAARMPMVMLGIAACCKRFITVYTRLMGARCGDI